MSLLDQVVPEGYKQTDIGVIPEEWKVATIEELAAIVDPQPDHRTPPESSNGEPYIGISDFINSKEVDWTSSRKIISKAVDKQEKSFQLKKGDIVFGKIGTIGVPKFVPQVPFRFALSANVILLQPKKIEPVYLMEFFYSELFQKTLKSELHSTSQAAFGMNKMRLIRLPLPPSKEQTAIASALSDVDALLTELEKLIAKKQAIKNATMQQLLTGKIRLSQFTTYTEGTTKGKSKSTKTCELGEIPEDWEVGALGEIAKFCKGKGLPKSDISDFGIFECIHYGELFTTYGPEVRSIQSKTNSVEDTIKSEANDILMPTSDVTPTGLATASGIKKKGVILGGDILIIRPHKDKLDSSFFSYLVAISKKQIMQLVTGSTVYHLYGSDMATFKFSYPSDIEEQSAIATILSDMDKEIQTLEQRLKKTRQIKQGMMQQLLTGRTRLPY
jgi:type I restriction enzyme S subunit